MSTQIKTELGALVEAAADAITPVAHAREARIVVRAPASAAFVSGHEAELQAMIIGFLSNAVRHCPPGGVVWVGIDTATDAHLVRVEDAGPGLPEAALAHVADPHPRTSRPVDAGLSLAAAHSLLRRLGGALTLQNRPEGGLRVLAMLPRIDG